MKRIVFSLALAAACLATPIAFAQSKGSAKDAYNRGLEAHKRGDHQKAAEEFALADSLAPSPVALQAALDAAIDADDPILGSDLVERSKREAPSGPLKDSVDAARTKFAGRAGRVKIACPTTCTATIDGANTDPKKTTFVKPGPHIVILHVDGDTQTKNVYVAADQTAEVVPSAKSAPPPTTPPPVAPRPPPEPVAQPAETPKPKSAVELATSKGLPPIVFIAGIGATVVLGGATGYFALQTQTKHDEFAKAGCDRANSTGCTELKEDGESRQAKTNILLATTVVAGVATAVIGIAFTNWKGPTVAPAPGGAVAGWGTRF